jgi:outer membrane lipoprotein-sorting protein
LRTAQPVLKNEGQPRIRHNARLADISAAGRTLDKRERDMAGRHAAMMLVTTLCAALVVGSVRAEGVPLPTPAPQPKAGGAAPGLVPPAAVPDSASAPGTSSDSTPDSSSQHTGLFPFSLPFGNDQATAFTEKQRHLLKRISKYLSNLQTLVGNFVQIGPDGGRTEGNFYIQKPGKVRFDYNPPSPIDVIADGSSVVVRNRDLNTQDLWPLSQTPLRYLLADHIDLLHDTDVVGVSSDDKFVTVVLEQKQVMVGTTRLTILFDAKDLTLKQWTVTDPQGLNTTVSLYNPDSTTKPDPQLFVINYPGQAGATEH